MLFVPNKYNIAAVLEKRDGLTPDEADRLLNDYRIDICAKLVTPEEAITEMGLEPEFILDLWHAGKQLDCCYPKDMKWHEASIEDRTA